MIVNRESIQLHPNLGLGSYLMSPLRKVDFSNFSKKCLLMISLLQNDIL